MQHAHVYRRLTFKYVDTYRHLDNSVFVGTAMLTPAHTTREGNGHDDGGTYVRLATLPAGMSAKRRKMFRAAMAESLSKHGCSHEYDCCGCASYSTRVLPTSNARKAIVVTRVGYNY